MFRGIVSVLAGEALAFVLLATVAADLAAHKRVETLGGVNIRGYRGPVAHQRQPNELRIVFVGGTRAFGWGEPASGTTVAAVRFELTRVLDVPNKPLMPIVAINLGRLGAPPESYASTLEHFAYLAPDYITIFDDLGDPGPNRPFDASGVYALTGYQPMLPLVLQEKGRVSSSRVIGAPIEYAGDAMAAVDRGLARLAGERSDAPPSRSSPREYALSMIQAIEKAHAHARGVLVVLSPIDNGVQQQNYDALLRLLSERRSPSWLRFVELRATAALSDPSLRLDGFSFGSDATSMAAQAIAPALLDLISSR